ncbi:helix-turn-helix transcriptional regulator [Microbulbifer rhizosphaerae]|uniref:Putative DNA-binding transcriptional regulator YafY n=1 Tax=Microbulbifer rhizosphaerae TaxID=1562603 RepID=A0A7W4W9B9_9GAMM|nr:YafY family protein [Microbulbifer rhizosphaerae]MBB3060004.1 putative DNA-binding transcriptional regulator YafY [Microbulbifer rhizosphaerae]
MKKSERLLQLLTLLRARRSAITARALAERLGVSERTLYRDMQSLVLSGVPVEGEAGVGYRLRRGSFIPPLMFSEEELEALLLGVRMVQGWGDEDIGSAADSALHKIRSVLPDRVIQEQDLQRATLLVPDLHRREKARFGALIRQAVKAREMLWLDYEDEQGNRSQRHCNPLGLIYWGAAWTLLAWCRLRGDHRLFRLDRILGAELTGEQFQVEPHQSLAAYFRQYNPEFNDRAF